MFELIILWFLGNVLGRYCYFVYNVWEYYGKSRVIDYFVYVVVMKYECFLWGFGYRVDGYDNYE